MALTKVTGAGIGTVTNQFADANMSAGSILQMKNLVVTNSATTTSTSFTDTGLFAAQFDNTLLSSSKVFAMMHCTIGQPYDGQWARLNYITIFDGSTNVGNANYGIAAGSPLGGSWSGTQYIQYDNCPLSGSVIFTPSSTNPTIKLAYKTFNNVSLRIGGNHNYGISAYYAATHLMIAEIGG